MSLRVTILGCGSSGGVPRIGPMWGQCDPSNPRNRRRRCSILVDRPSPSGATRVLVDTSPDLRDQLLTSGVQSLDAVLFTHDHADHTHGIDDLRMVAYAMKKRVDCYFDVATRESIVSRFGYCFETREGSSYPPILVAQEVTPGRPLHIEGRGGALEVLPIEQVHGDIATLGFRFGGVAYSPDISDIPGASLSHFEGLEVWIVDALRHTPHPSHFHLKRTLEWIERFKPKRAILTHMTGDLDYETLRRELPDNVEPAYDGMVVEVA
jgi:phosphoribosyl 1,2-cyclic phosphate phosphodiesterase